MRHLRSRNILFLLKDSRGLNERLNATLSNPFRICGWIRSIRGSAREGGPFAVPPARVDAPLSHMLFLLKVANPI